MILCKKCGAKQFRRVDKVTEKQKIRFINGENYEDVSEFKEAVEEGAKFSTNSKELIEKGEWICDECGESAKLPNLDCEELL